VSRFNLKIGLIICLLVSVVSTIPRVIRLDSLEYLGILTNALFSFFILFVFWIINNFFIQFDRIKNQFYKVSISIILCVLISLLYHKLISLFSDRVNYLVDTGVDKDKQTVIIIFRGFLLGSFLYFISYYLNMLFEKQKVQLELEKIKQENLEARLNSLRQQISPHFLFNSLSTLRTIATDLETKDYILQLANVYRYLLSYNENYISTLKDELEFTHSYLYILNQRFEDALVINIDLDTKLFQKRIPPLTLQILIENAIKHNVVSIDEPLRIDIFSPDNENLIIRNNLQLKSSGNENTGKGLQNINGRYQLLAQKEIEIKTDKRNFVVTVPLLA